MKNYYFRYLTIHWHGYRKLIRWKPKHNGFNHFYFLKFEVILL